LGALTTPATAETGEQAAMQKERVKATTALSGATPTPDEFKKAEKAIAALKELLKQCKKMAALGAMSPEAAVEARKAFKGFRDKRLDEDVTPEVIAKTKKDIQDAQKQMDDSKALWNSLGVVPTGETEEQKQVREQKRNEAAQTFHQGKAKKEKAVEREKKLL